MSRSVQRWFGGKSSVLGLLGALGTMMVLGVTAGCAADADESQGATEAAATERPPQFVVLAFDGSYNLDFWKESRAFATQNHLDFTYFISGVYFLGNANKGHYKGPRHGAGASDIGFGGTAAEIAERLEQVRLANAEGNEIASHANGHFDGSAWSESDWTQEFSRFDDLVFKAGPNNGFAQPDLGFGAKDVVGFRAPLLAFSAGMYKTLPARGYAYDTSKSGAPNYWPQKLGGVWNFPLAQLKIAGTGRNTLSMDYNFYVAQSGGSSRAANKETYKKQMVDTYMKYFQGNYFGNRAPIHIGHHFSKWNGGAYWEAMQTFAKRVCGQPEVKCVTYRELAKYMEDHAGDRDRFQRGGFTPMPRPPGIEAPQPVAPPVAEEDLAANGFVGDVESAHDEGANEEEP